jgi:hypothetical protein
MISKLAFAGHILGMAMWCGAATSGHAVDTPGLTVPSVSVSQPPRRQPWVLGRHTVQP